MKVDVLLPLKFDHPFTYLNEKDEALEVGDFVLVPFNNKKIVGVIWSLKPSVTKKNIKFRPVFEKLDLQKLSKSKIEFIIKFATYNLIELGLVLKLFIFNPYFQAKNKKKIQENNNFENSKIEKEILLDSTQQKSYEYLT
ncbi:MAG: primosomal protein N', partial [Candidatus Fonsibacter sp.]